MHDPDARAQMTQPGRTERPGGLPQQFNLPGSRALHSAKDPQQGRLACTRRADDRDSLAGGSVKRHIDQRHIAVGVDKADPGKGKTHLSNPAACAASSMPA